MSLIPNEQTKLSATAPNGVAIASIAAGFIAPPAALTFGAGASTARGGLLRTVFSLVWLAGGVTLHFPGNAVVEEARAMTSTAIYLQLLGPAPALVAGCSIYLIARYA